MPIPLPRLRVTAQAVRRALPAGTTCDARPARQADPGDPDHASALRSPRWQSLITRTAPGDATGQMTPAATERNRSAFRAWLSGHWLHAAEAEAQSAARHDERPGRRHREGKTTRKPAPSTWTSTRVPRPFACPRAVSNDLDCSGRGVQISAQFMAAVLGRAFVVQAPAAAGQGGDGNIAQRPSAARAGNRARYRNVP